MLNSCYLYAPICGFAVYFRVWTEGDSSYCYYYYYYFFCHSFSVLFSRIILHFIASFMCKCVSEPKNGMTKDTRKHTMNSPECNDILFGKFMKFNSI